MNNEYQTLLPDCDCKSGGIIMYNNKPVCRWCRKPYGNGGVMYYLPEHFAVSEPVKERIEISSFNTLSRFTPVGKVIQVLEVVTDKKITGDRFPAIKQAIESCLNELVIEILNHLMKDVTLRNMFWSEFAEFKGFLALRTLVAFLNIIDLSWMKTLPEAATVVKNTVMPFGRYQMVVRGNLKAKLEQIGANTGSLFEFSGGNRQVHTKNRGAAG